MRHLPNRKKLVIRERICFWRKGSRKGDFYKSVADNLPAEGEETRGIGTGRNSERERIAVGTQEAAVSIHEEGIYKERIRGWRKRLPKVESKRTSTPDSRHRMKTERMQVESLRSRVPPLPRTGKVNLAVFGKYLSDLEAGTRAGNNPTQLPKSSPHRTHSVVAGIARPHHIRARGAGPQVNASGILTRLEAPNFVSGSHRHRLPNQDDGIGAKGTNPYPGRGEQVTLCKLHQPGKGIYADEPATPQSRTCIPDPRTISLPHKAATANAPKIKLRRQPKQRATIRSQKQARPNLPLRPKLNTIYLLPRAQRKKP
jgi:hypothetical protein